MGLKRVLGGKCIPRFEDRLAAAMTEARFGKCMGMELGTGRREGAPPGEGKREDMRWQLGLQLGS
jgi:hypothetical protein